MSGISSIGSLSNNLFQYLSQSSSSSASVSSAIQASDATSGSAPTTAASFLDQLASAKQHAAGQTQGTHHHHRHQSQTSQASQSTGTASSQPASAASDPSDAMGSVAGTTTSQPVCGSQAVDPLSQVAGASGSNQAISGSMLNLLA